MAISDRVLIDSDSHNFIGGNRMGRFYHRNCFNSNRFTDR